MLVVTANKDSEAIDFEVIVLGAGISGLVSASVLLTQGYKKILVVDEYDHIGGNHIDRKIGEYSFDIGSFIFQDDSPLLKHLPELLPLYIIIHPSWGRLNPQGRVAKYPISIRDDIVLAGPAEWLRMVLSVLAARIFHRRLLNARDFARYWIGDRLLHRTGLQNYMRRFYGVSAEEVDISFAEKRMQWIRERASFRRIISRWRRPSNLHAENVVRPREGFSYLYQGTKQRLERDGVTFVLGAKMLGLEKRERSIVLEIERQRFAGSRVVSTIPLERAQDLCGLVSSRRLQTVSLISLFFSFSGNRGFSYSILYNFSHSGAWKRLTVYSDFYGLSDDREFFTVEVNAHHVDDSVDRAERDFRQHTQENGLFIGDLRLEGSHTLSNAYPIYTGRADEEAARAIAALREFGIESFGRQGGFDYQPTARVSTLEAEAALHRN